jgi:hypothetical protein
MTSFIDTEAHATTLASLRDHPLYDDYWKGVATTDVIAKAEVPALTTSSGRGGFDAFEKRSRGT